uniref:Uncharacterized protein n=1 Tax=Rhizophagus irregularis (strain DAOM 181602 / DAOM 197198 / MUCL 43194) TaxID=747089 RepID=U9UI11_RHIID
MCRYCPIFENKLDSCPKIFFIFNKFIKGTFPLLKSLKSLKVVDVPANICKNIIDSTKGNLIEISIIYQYHQYNPDDNGKLIQKIYQKCPNLKFLELTLYKENITEFKNLLINCQSLISLEIIDHTIKWNKLFEVLKFSPISLFKFKFSTEFKVLYLNLKYLKLFLDNWNDRNPMLLHLNIGYFFIRRSQQLQQYVKLRKRLNVFLQEYKAKELNAKHTKHLQVKIMGTSLKWVFFFHNIIRRRTPSVLLGKCDRQ